MTFAINITDGRGLSNEERRELQPKKSKVMLYKTELISFKCERAVRVIKLIKEDQLTLENNFYH